MAAPIFHIIFAYIALSFLPESVDKAEFLRGTSFPDIRYMANLDREKTHLTPVSWERIKNEKSSFIAGMMFHNLLDELRIREIEKKYYDKSAKKGFDSLSKKMAEDALIYDYLSPKEWSEISELLVDISNETEQFGVSTELSEKWFNSLSEYVSKQPDEESIYKFLKATNKGGVVKMNIQHFYQTLSDYKLKTKILDMIKRLKSLFCI